MEIIMAVAAVVAMARIADVENEGAVKWGAITIGLIVVCGVFIPMMFVRVLAAFVAAFVLLTIFKKGPGGA